MTKNIDEMHPHANIKTVLPIIAIAVFIVLSCWMLLKRNAIMAYADRHILLENAHRGYYYLQNSKTERKVLQTILDGNSANLVNNTLSTRNYDEGFSITVHEDGSFTYSGANNAGYDYYLTINAGRFFNKSGDFIVSDTKALDDPEISQDGIYIYLQNRIYDIGGDTEYPVTYDLRSGTQRFTIATDDSSEYYLCICITSGFTSDGITFYPMITSADQESSTFHPCTITDYSAITSPSVSFDYYAFSRGEFLQMTDSDLKRFYHALEYQSSASWSTIDFQDGTGLVFSRGEDNKNNTSEVYGVLDNTGRVQTPLGGIQDIPNEQEPLQKINTFGCYLSELNKSNYTIVVAVRDNGFGALVNRDNYDLRTLGMKTEISWNNYRCSYYAVLNPGNDAVEEISDQALAYSGTLADGTTFEINSRGYVTGEPVASIKLNDKEWSMNRRGMNFVVYDNMLHKVVDTVCFDTCSGLDAYHPANLLEQ